MMLRGEAGPGGELARVGEFPEVGKLGNDDLGADFSEARDGLEQLAFGEEFGVGLDDFGDVGAGVGEFFFLHPDATFDRNDDGFFGLGLEFGFKACGVLSERVGVTAEFGNPLLVMASRMPGEEFEVLGFDEAGDEFGVGGVAFVAPELLHSESFDPVGIDQIDAVGVLLIEGGDDGVAIMAGLFETGAELLARGGFGEPSGEQSDPCRRVGEAVGAGIFRADHMAEEFGFSDIDSEEKARRMGGF